MKEIDAIEQAYRNGLEEGKKLAATDIAKRLLKKKFNKNMFNEWASASYVVLVRDIKRIALEYGVDLDIVGDER